MGHSNWLEGRLLLGHSLVGCSSGETADRYKDKPTRLGWVSAGCRASLAARSDLLLGGLEVVVDLAGDVALEDPHDLSFTFALGSAALDVGLGSRVAAHPGEGDPP